MTDNRESAIQTFIDRSRPFLGYLIELESGWPAISLAEHLKMAGRSPQETAVFCVDVTEGFCRQGALASPRVGQIVQPIVRLLRNAHSLGVQHFLLPQDAHQAEAEEFQSYPAHSLAGTSESQTVSDVTDLPFSNLFQVIPKNSIRSDAGTVLPEWLENHPDVREFIVVGDCTDICVYLLAIYLKTRSGVRGLGQRVTVPADCVDTYDLPVDVARPIGVVPHDGELLHRLFLYHMALNGITIVKTLTP